MVIKKKIETRKKTEPNQKTRKVSKHFIIFLISAFILTLTYSILGFISPSEKILVTTHIDKFDLGFKSYTIFGLNGINSISFTDSARIKIYYKDGTKDTLWFTPRGSVGELYIECNPSKSVALEYNTESDREGFIRLAHINDGDILDSVNHFSIENKSSISYILTIDNPIHIKIAIQKFKTEKEIRYTEVNFTPKRIEVGYDVSYKKRRSTTPLYLEILAEKDSSLYIKNTDTSKGLPKVSFFNYTTNGNTGSVIDGKMKAYQLIDFATSDMEGFSLRNPQIAFGLDNTFVVEFEGGFKRLNVGLDKEEMKSLLPSYQQKLGFLFTYTLIFMAIIEGILFFHNNFYKNESQT